MLAGVVAAKWRNDRVARLATDDEPIILADARPGPIQIEFEKVQSNLANVRLGSSHRYGTGPRVREGGRRTRIPEVGPVVSNGISAGHLYFGLKVKLWLAFNWFKEATDIGRPVLT